MQPGDLRNKSLVAGVLQDWVTAINALAQPIDKLTTARDQLEARHEQNSMLLQKLEYL